jgi:hypothetical protein
MNDQTTYAMFHQQVPVDLQATAEAAALKLAAEKAEKEKGKSKAAAD